MQSRPFSINHLMEELGDTLWCLAIVAQSAGVTLDSVAAANIAKLATRYPNGFPNTLRPDSARCRVALAPDQGRATRRSSFWPKIPMCWSCARDSPTFFSDRSVHRLIGHRPRGFAKTGGDQLELAGVRGHRRPPHRSRRVQSPLWLFTRISSFAIFSPHCAITPISLTKPSIGSTTSASIWRTVFALDILERQVGKPVRFHQSTPRSCSS